MNTINTEDIEQIITTLDDFLYKGYLLKTHTTDDWNLRSQKKDTTLNIETYKAEFMNNINIWLNETANFLTTCFKEKHYYFHFVHPEEDALSISHPLGNLTHALAKHLFALEDIIVRLEERRNLAIRQDIAKKEYQADILYEITYSSHTREVKLNNLILTKTDFNSENDNCFQFIYANAGRPIGFEELKGAVGGKVKKRVVHIVRDLGFENELKDIFFPVVTKDKLMFVNPITKQYADKHNLPPINFSKIRRQSKP